MAILSKFLSQSTSHEFSDAYSHISEIGVTLKFLNMIVSTFASLDARNKQKHFEFLNKQVEDAHEKTIAAQTAMNSHKQDFERLTQEVNTIQDQITAKKASKDKLVDAQRQLDSFLVSTWNKTYNQYTQASEAENKLRDELSKLSPVSPLESNKYTFPISEDELNKQPIFELAYSKLKEVGTFKNAKDV